MEKTILNHFQKLIYHLPVDFGVISWISSFTLFSFLFVDIDMCIRIFV